MSATGNPSLTQAEQDDLNADLYESSGWDDDLPSVVKLLNCGANPNALVGGLYNALHMATRFSRLQIVPVLIDRCADLELRCFRGLTALLCAAFFDHFKMCLLLIARGADLRVVDDRNRTALEDYALYANSDQGIDPAVKALRVAELKKAWREGSHPSQVQRRKDENWAKRWPLMNVSTGCGFLLMAAKKAELKATALPTDAKLPDEPTETEEQRRALRHSKVLGNIDLVQRIASFIPERGEGEDSLDGNGEEDEEKKRVQEASVNRYFEENIVVVRPPQVVWQRTKTTA